MAYLVPSEFVAKMVDAGESKIFMSTRDTIIRAYMAGAILALAAWFAITINVATGQPIIGALLFPVGFVMLNLFGFDLLTGVFVLTPLALIDKRPGVTLAGVLMQQFNPGPDEPSLAEMREFRDTMTNLAQRGLAVYRELIHEDDGLFRMFRAVTPIDACLAALL